MLMTLKQVLKLGNLAADTDKEKVLPYIYEAEDVMRQHLGTTYDTYKDAEASEDSQDGKNKLARAEAFLTLSLLVPVLNLRANSDEGGFVGSIGFAESKNTLLSRKEIEKIAQDFNDRAFRIIHQFIEVSSTDTEYGDGFGMIAVGDPDAVLE